MVNNEPSVIYDFNPNNLPAKYLRAVGLVAATAAQTEHILQEFIGALLGIDHIQNLALTTHMSYPLKDNIIRALAELDAPNLDELDKIDELLDEAESAINKRNIIVHNAFAIHPDTGEILSHRLKARGSLQLEFKPVSVEELEQDAATIYKVGLNIMDFMISRNLAPRVRIKALRQPVNRGKKARTKRRNISA
jgi:hypothetical protein